MSLNKCLLSLPTEKLPECWKDEARMNVLFAPFRNRSVNPQDWDSKLSFWNNLIFNCCVQSKIYTFKVEDLKKLFNIDGRSPSCLAIVIDEMYKSGEIKPVAEFLQKPAESWSRWAADIFIKKPIVWSYSKVKNSLLSPNLADHSFVHLAAVESDSEKLLSSLPEQYRNTILSLQELLDIVGIESNKVDDFKLLLHHLICKNKADVKEVTSDTKQEVPLHNLLVKLGDIKKVNPISDADISIHILQQNEKTLANTVEKLENEVVSIIADAKSYLSKGQRQMAKGCLRKKHEVESRITKRVAALQNIQALLLKVHDVDSDSHVLETYKLALSTLRKSFKENNLSEDTVADTMTEIADMLDMHEDIQSSLSQSVSGNDEAELEEELAELLANNNGDNASPPPKPSSPLKPDTEDSDTIALEKRLAILKLPIVSPLEPNISQERDKVAL